MIQTYEGALTETDSILQRMKTLADQAANGTYQDDVDRDAIQLEFEQLNDELNQIADTDFNGVVVLNGGEMADGLKATDGKFDYTKKEAQLMAKASEMLRNDMTTQSKIISDAKAAMAKEKFDLTNNGTAPEWQTVDNSKYTKTGADKIWQQLEITDDNTSSGDAKTDIINSLDVTFEFDGTNWKAVKAVGNEGTVFDDATKLSAAFATTNAGVANSAAGDVNNVAGTSNVTGKGGFTVTCGESAGTADAELVNAVFDATNAKKGDTVTLKFTNAEKSQLRPDNGGLSMDSLEIVDNTVSTTTPANTLDASDFSVTMLASDADDKTDEVMTAEIDKAFETLNNNGNFTLTYAGTDDTGTAAATLKLSIGNISEYDLKSANTTPVNFQIDGVDYSVKSDAAAPDKLTFYAGKGAETGKELFELNIEKPVKDTAAKDSKGTNGTVSGSFKFSTSKFVDSSSSVYVTTSKSETLGTSEKYQNQIKDAETALADLSKVKVTNYESAKEYLTAKGVSVSDALDNATAPLTYTDHIMLQAGARSKDLVDFTFKYTSGGLGDLKANMNCSAREDGLGTAGLKLTDQKSANYAIDRIDNAINKVSMVRATFGAVQNRLEHKIDNMNVTKENLTSAESRIRDTNMAEEMTNFTKNQILSQASQAMLAQANQLPQGVLQLLG